MMFFLVKLKFSWTHNNKNMSEMVIGILYRGFPEIQLIDRIAEKEHHSSRILESFHIIKHLLGSTFQMPSFLILYSFRQSSEVI